MVQRDNKASFVEVNSLHEGGKISQQTFTKMITPSKHATAKRLERRKQKKRQNIGRSGKKDEKRDETDS